MQTEYFARDPLAWQIQPVTGMIVRTVGLVLCAASWWWLGAKGQESGSSGGIPMILAAHAVLIVAAIFLAKPLAGVLGDWASGLFMPGARHSCPQPMYSIPEGRMMAEDYSGALEAYAALAA